MYSYSNAAADNWHTCGEGSGNCCAYRSALKGIHSIIFCIINTSLLKFYGMSESFARTNNSDS